MAPYISAPSFLPFRSRYGETVFNTPGAVDKWHGNARDAAMRRQTPLAS